MRIGIYVEAVKHQQLRGVGYHVLHLVHALSRLDRDNQYYLYYQRPLWGSAGMEGRCPDQPNFRRRPVRVPSLWAIKRPRLFWNYYLPFLLRLDRIDVFHGPSHMLPAIAREKTVVTIHDLAYFWKELYTPEMTAAMRHWTTAALQRAGRVIALSENTCRDLKGLGVEPDRLRVIYGGGNIIPEDQIMSHRWAEVRQHYHLPDRYILFVGLIHPRKNVTFLLRSFAKLKRERGIPQSLVLVGKRDSASDEVERLIRELRIQSEVVLTGYVEEWQVPLFYKMADVFVLPTLYEGFTLVTLEAMAYGTPVVATDTSSIREGVGDAALLVPVDDVDALARALWSVVGDAHVRWQLIERGKIQAQKFGWERCAQETLAVYRELYEKARLNPLKRPGGTLTQCVPA